MDALRTDEPARGDEPASAAPSSDGPNREPPAFERRPDDTNLGRLAESTVWVNESHPAYLRAAASRSEGYHLALTVALALAPLAAEPPEVLSFVTTFLSRWGEVTDRPTRRR